MWAEGIKGGIWGCTEERHLGTPNPSLPSAQAASSQARLGEEEQRRIGLMHVCQTGGEGMRREGRASVWYPREQGSLHY